MTTINEDKHLVKGRWDFRNPSLKVICDFKTTVNGSPFDYKGFGSSVKKLRYDLQAAWYLHHANKLLNDEYSFCFIAVESSYPYCVSLHTLSDKDLESARQEIFEILDKYLDHKSKGYWPGYGDQIHTIKMF